jgi:uncharacterized protein (TIGR00106 family)
MVVHFSTFPIGKGEAVGKYVAKVLDLIDKSGLKYQVGSMGTSLEGEWDEIIPVLKKCHLALRKKCPRVYTSIIIDDRKKGKNRLKGKVDDLEKLLNRKLSR